MVTLQELEPSDDSKDGNGPSDAQGSRDAVGEHRDGEQASVRGTMWHRDSEVLEKMVAWLGWEKILTEWKLSCTQAKRMKSLLPEILKFLGLCSWDVSVMAMETFHNILGHLKKKEASSIALKAVPRLCRLFDAVRMMWADVSQNGGKHEGENRRET